MGGGGGASGSRPAEGGGGGGQSGQGGQDRGPTSPGGLLGGAHWERPSGGRALRRARALGWFGQPCALVCGQQHGALNKSLSLSCPLHTLTLLAKRPLRFLLASLCGSRSPTEPGEKGRGGADTGRERGPQAGNRRVRGGQEEEPVTVLKWPFIGHRPPGALWQEEMDWPLRASGEDPPQRRQRRPGKLTQCDARKSRSSERVHADLQASALPRGAHSPASPSSLQRPGSPRTQPRGVSWQA